MRPRVTNHVTSAQGLPKRVTPQLTYSMLLPATSKKKMKEKGGPPMGYKGMGEVGYTVVRI